MHARDHTYDAYMHNTHMYIVPLNHEIYRRRYICLANHTGHLPLQ